jgi:hypothetical protein
MLARHLDLATVLGYLRTVQTFFETLFPHLGITSMAAWDAGRAMRAALRCEVPKVHTLEQIREVLTTISVTELQQELATLALPKADEAEPGRLQQARDAYCERIFTARLYGYLTPEARLALSRAAVYGVPVTLDGLAAVTGLPVEAVRNHTLAW